MSSLQSAKQMDKENRNIISDAYKHKNVHERKQQPQVYKTMIPKQIKS